MTRRAGSARFGAKILAGYATVILLLAGGMVFAIARIESLTNAQVTRIRAEEQEITVVEALRWRGELIVSAGRGYLISEDPSLLVSLHRAEAAFDDGVHALRNGSLTPRGEQLVSQAERAANRFRQAQTDLLEVSQRLGEGPTRVHQFEDRLLPLHENLSRALERLAEHKQLVISTLYAETAADRARLSQWTYTLVALLVMLGCGVAFYFSRLLTRTYRKEEDARTLAATALGKRDEVMGMVAHDLRNPLASITMRAGYMRKRAESEQTRHQAAAIENVAGRMEHLIQTMLDVTTMEAGRFSVATAPCSTEDLMRETHDMLGGVAAGRHVQLACTSEEPGLAILGDRERVLQVLSNLVGNAIKFTPAGGEVTVACERDGKLARFGVSDMGPGVPPENATRIFDRFWKQESGGIKGTGLGLFIAKSIVEAHGGTIWVENNPDRGATFYFTVPIAPDAHTSVHAPTASQKTSPNTAAP